MWQVLKEKEGMNPVTERFARFTMTLSKLNKCIQKLKTNGMGAFGLKAVDTLCIYQLARCGEMNFSQVAESCELDAGLVSRTLRDLVKNGMVVKSGTPGKYNATYSLTEQGKERSEYIRKVVLAVQDQADEGISTEDLAVFYRVLDRLTHNFEEMLRKQDELLHGENTTVQEK